MKTFIKIGLFAVALSAFAAFGIAQKAEAERAAKMTVEKNTDRLGGDYSGFFLDKPQPNLCRKACKEDDQCVAYTYVKPGVQDPTRARCYLKNVVPPPTPNDCCESGVKE